MLPELVRPRSLSPSPAEKLAHHIAQGEKHGGPNESRAEVRKLELPPRHPENAGDQRDRGAQGSKEAADENRKRPPALHECFALGQQFRMSRQRPDVRDWRSEFDADPEGWAS